MIEQVARQNDIQYIYTLWYLHVTITSYVVVPDIPLELERPLAEHDPEVRAAREPSQPRGP